MISLKRTDARHKDFVAMVRQLDAYLKITDGEEHDFYNQFNAIDNLKYVVLAYSGNDAVGCGSFKKFDEHIVEIKRMFTLPQARNKAIGSMVLGELENWASELGFKFAILETGIRQEEAVKFYKKNNYQSIPNYGPYKTRANSLCFKKEFH